MLSVFVFVTDLFFSVTVIAIVVVVVVVDGARSDKTKREPSSSSPMTAATTVIRKVRMRIRSGITEPVIGSVWRMVSEIVSFGKDKPALYYCHHLRLLHH